MQGCCNQGPALRCQAGFVLRLWDSADWDGLGVLACTYVFVPAVLVGEDSEHWPHLSSGWTLAFTTHLRCHLLST